MDRLTRAEAEDWIDRLEWTALEGEGIADDFEGEAADMVHHHVAILRSMIEDLDGVLRRDEDDR